VRFGARPSPPSPAPSPLVPRLALNETLKKFCKHDEGVNHISNEKVVDFNWILRQQQVYVSSISLSFLIAFLEATYCPMLVSYESKIPRG